MAALPWTWDTIAGKAAQQPRSPGAPGPFKGASPGRAVLRARKE